MQFVSKNQQLPNQLCIYLLFICTLRYSKYYYALGYSQLVKLMLRLCMYAMVWLCWYNQLTSATITETHYTDSTYIIMLCVCISTSSYVSNFNKYRSKLRELNVSRTRMHTLGTRTSYHQLFLQTVSVLNLCWLINTYIHKYILMLLNKLLYYICTLLLLITLCLTLFKESSDLYVTTHMSVLRCKATIGGI